MAITWEIDPVDDVILERWEGVITAADVSSHWRSFLVDPTVLACRRTLVDLRPARLAVYGHELAALVRDVAVPLLGDLNWRTAIVVDEPAEFGFARQYQELAEVFSKDAIFFDTREARRWLTREQPPAG
jgi:hypothetical protein